MRESMVDFSHKIIQKDSCEYKYCKMCCTTIQLGVTIDIIDFVVGWKKLQVCFQTIVDNFSLTIILGMIGGFDMQLGSL
jgi:hypothetical protein